MRPAEPGEFDRQISPTAASVSNRLFGTSGEMRYLVLLSSSGGQKGTVVTASTGDSAAEQALQRNPGCKVVFVGPATDQPPVIEAEAA